VRDLALETNYPIQLVRVLLQLAQTPMRPRGRPLVRNEGSSKSV
jgi:hypothetical protein